MFSSFKDSLASSAAKSLLAGRIERYGRLIELRIRSREKIIRVEILLAGESEELKIEVERYRVTESGGSHAIVIERIRASRQWVQLLLEDFVVGKPLPIPAVAIMALGGPEAAAPPQPGFPAA
ncbi:hypothetical protein OJ996_03495 [Luteolibacter sp. GHJ8]|jgi:hypothetical protein|uniref:Uncharacterized protein n=1 Tax=Luteolibacter rhizosphaerae TaxID=2989719 RepID=A0ABT3FZ73_9BACT|nr:hypothetical protein [Luteolibacter rhizosphaerae]MCW1912624.1 hypothetical protein [Luteolibacter rhizosphaerae]